MDEKFFPEYLNAGSKHPAVVLLKIVLIVLDFNRYIVINDSYDAETIAGVKKLQCLLGFKGTDIDGHFGPKIRRAFLKSYGLDVNYLRVSDFQGEKIVVTPD